MASNLDTTENLPTTIGRFNRFMNKHKILYEQTVRVNNVLWLAVSILVSILKQRPRNPCKIRGFGVRVIIPTHLVLKF